MQVLRTVRKARWLSSLDWLDEGDVQADALDDLRTRGNTLSVWLIHDDESNLQRVIAALASTRDYISNFDFVLVDESLILSVVSEFRSELGETADTSANREWHRDVTFLTAKKLLSLAKTIQHRGRIRRISEKQVHQWIQNSVAENHLNVDNIKDGIKKKL